MNIIFGFLGIIGIIWGISGVYLIRNFFITFPDTHPLPPDTPPHGSYSALGKILMFPAWLSAKLLTPDGRLVYAGPNTDMKPKLFILSALLGALLLLILAFILNFIFQ